MSDGMGWTFTTLGRATVAAAFGGGILIGTLPGHAEDPPSRNSGNPTTGTSEEGFWSPWLNMVSRTQAEQPHWITPLVSNNSILTQSFHYDVFPERFPTATPPTTNLTDNDLT